MRYIDSPKVRVTENFSPSHTYTFTGPCVVTGEAYSVTIAGANLFAFRQSDNVLDLGLNADDREFVMSGTSPKGWDQLFGGGED